MANPLPSIDELFERFEPDSTSPSGLRYRVDMPRIKRKAGDQLEEYGDMDEILWACDNVEFMVAGSKSSNVEGYWNIVFKGTVYRAHRIVMYLRGGVDRPDLSVDHKDRNVDNNHPFNLRWANASEQSRNRGNYGKCLKGGHLKKGHKSKPYNAQIRLNGKMKHLGYYATEKEAHQAYLNAVRVYQQP